MNKFKIRVNLPNILLLLIVIISILSQKLPLVQVLNFEFSFLFSILLFLTSGILTIFYLRKFKSFGVLPAIIRMKYRSYLYLLFAPLLISIISNLLFQICPIGDGILYYFVVVIPAYFFGFATGAFAFWSNKKFSYLIFISIFFIFVLTPILEFYIYPQVYFYNVIVGIIPGTIYDEEILLSSKLVIYRIIHFVLFSILLYSIFKVGSIKKKERKLLMLSTVLAVVLFFLLKPYLGYATTKYELFENLKASMLTPDIEIRYADNLTTNNATILAFESIYYLKEVERKTKLSTPKNLISYVFKDSKQKGALFGSKAANVAKPWMNQIFLDNNSAENTLEHELVHIFAAEIGSTPFKIADGFNMAMLEGYAMAIEDNYSGYDIHYMALLAKSSGYNFDIPALFLPFNFFSNTSSLSYILAGSFVKYLIETYGIEKVNLLYQNLNFEKHIDKNLLQLSEEYNQFLDSLNYPINKERANLFFGRRPITKKVCPRTVASNLKNAWQLFREGSYFLSHAEFLKIYNYSNSFSALLGVIYSNNKTKKYNESLSILESNIKNYEGTSSYYSALLNWGDQLVFNDSYQKADSVYKILSEYEPTWRYKNLAKIRIELIAKEKIFNYLSGSDFDKYQILKLLNKEKLFDASIPIMIELSERLDENISSFIFFLEDINFKNISSNSAFELSKYFMRNLKFRESLKFANISIEKCNEKFMLPVLKSHKKKVDWLCN